MRQRCNDPKHIAWKYYGGRGIRVCERWQDDYDAFVEDMGFCPDGLTIERINGNQDYTPENCRWASRKEQARNRSGNNLISYQGTTKTITDWAQDLGISVGAIQYRLDTGLTIDEVLRPERRRSIEASHGTVSRYTNRKCRCDLCRAALKEYTRQRRSKIREHS